MSAKTTAETSSSSDPRRLGHRTPRRLLAIVAAFGVLATSGCTGGDAISDEPAEDAGTASPGGTGPGSQEQPAGTPGLSDPSDDLTEPTPGT